MRIILLAAAVLAVQSTPLPEQRGRPRQILLIGDRPSHGPLQHEHNAAAHLLQKWLNSVPGVSATAHFDGFPADLSVLDRADAVFMFCTGGNRHYVFQDEARTRAVQAAADRGAGLMFFHYCVEPPAERGRQEMLDWIGGYFETHYSVNPHWTADFKTLPSHPITRGVAPFALLDEWYYNMRFPPGGDAAHGTAILSAVPGPDTLTRPDGPHSGNPDVRAKAGQPHAVMWAHERAHGGRGVGFTGGHFHANFGDANFRTLVLNALLWIAKVDVPAGGVKVNVTPDELKERLDPKPPRPPRQSPGF